MLDRPRSVFQSVLDPPVTSLKIRQIFRNVFAAVVWNVPGSKRESCWENLCSAEESQLSWREGKLLGSDQDPLNVNEKKSENLKNRHCH